MGSKRFLLITGCPRSGTTFSSRAFSTAFKDRTVLPHEQIGRLGTVSWCFGPPSWEEPLPRGINASGKNHHDQGERPSDFAFRTTALVVRHPLKVIASAKKMVAQRDWDWIAKHVDIDPKAPKLLRGALFWMAWNKMVMMRASFYYQVEQMDLAWPELLKAAQLPLVPFPTLSTTINRSSGFKTARPITLPDIRSLSQDTASALIGVAGTFGYEL